MKKQITQSIVGIIALLFLFVAVQAQSVTLTFTGRDANNNRVQLDRVSITNLTKGWQETIYWPDTTLTMQNGGTGIDDYANNGGFVLSQNNPNPFNGTTDVLLAVADAGTMTLDIADVNGRIVVGANDYSPLPGHHQFRVTLSAAGTYVMTARQNGKSSSIKMVNNGGGNGNGIEYAGEIVKTTHALSQQPKSHIRGTTTNPFNFGDMMEYVGYATINGTEVESERISQIQGASQTFALVFDLYASGSPMVSTLSVSNLTSSSAEVSGIVLSDGGNIVVERGFCWDTLASPTLNNASLQCGAGVGNFMGVISGLMAETTYYVRAYATNGEGTSYGAVFSFTTPQYTGGNGGGNGGSGGGGGEHTYVEWDGEGLNPNDSYPCEGAPTLTDIDGNVYNTVQIGNQCWMKENLRTKTYRGGSPISQGASGQSGASTTIGYWYYPDGNSSNMSTYGLIYNYKAVSSGICPTGWHLPSYTEWRELRNYMLNQIQYACAFTYIGKAMASPTDWSSSDEVCAVGNTPSTNNASGFSALPAGRFYSANGGICLINVAAEFWGSGSSIAIYYSQAEVEMRSTVTAEMGRSVRCLKD
ncbi:MAG: T9SS type A sorting domain-containing protein [Bacteroidales bacterium]|nr:T9SS type A sorting domain-containing protein [Bacteroidales bacterium]